MRVSAKVDIEVVQQGVWKFQQPVFRTGLRSSSLPEPEIGGAETGIENIVMVARPTFDGSAMTSESVMRWWGVFNEPRALARSILDWLGKSVGFRSSGNSATERTTPE